MHKTLFPETRKIYRRDMISVTVTWNSVTGLIIHFLSSGCVLHSARATAFAKSNGRRVRGRVRVTGRAREKVMKLCSKSMMIL